METDTFEPAKAILKELDIRFAIMYSPQEFAQTFSHLAARRPGRGATLDRHRCLGRGGRHLRATALFAVGRQDPAGPLFVISPYPANT